jgi:hypothetical protein
MALALPFILIYLFQLIMPPSIPLKLLMMNTMNKLPKDNGVDLFRKIDISMTTIK